MEKECTSLPKLRRKILTDLTHEGGLCVGCIFFKGSSCKLPPSLNRDRRFDCGTYDFVTEHITYFIFIKEEK
ncbi:hypothetical protein RZS08_30395, partial [Arthrospira platensis SPKY1]|nr:hypothetical protein [Arthrospira platensis SPKY1]